MEARVEEAPLALQSSSLIESLRSESTDFEGENEPTPPFLNPPCLAALEAIRGRAAHRKRLAVVHMVIARVNGLRGEAIYQDGSIVSRVTWHHYYTEPEVRTAYEVLMQHALAWRDRETMRIELEATNLRRRALAQASLEAVRSLYEMVGNDDGSPGHRLKAAKLLLALTDFAHAARIALVERGVAVPVEMKDLEAMIDDELQRFTVAREVGLKRTDIPYGAY